MEKRLKIRLVIIITLFLGAICSLYAVFNEDQRGILTVAFLNIGQGDSIYIEAPSGNQMLIDGGPGKSVLRELSKMMPFYDHSLDVVVATHPDSDHISGLNDVLDKYKVGLFIEPGVEGDTAIYKELNSKIERLKIKRLETRRGMEVDLGGGAILEILFPISDPRGMETNTASIVARLIYGENEFLLTGDSPKNIEDYLVSLESSGCQGQPLNCPGPKGLPLTLRSDVLKAGHHGSKTSTGEPFVKAVSPEYAVISAGKNNRYGHPHQEVLDILNNFGAKILRTDELGRIVFKSDGVNLKIK